MTAFSSIYILKLFFRYDPATGVFTAQFAGVYYFTVFVSSEQSANEDNFNIFKNDEFQCVSRAEGSETDLISIVPTCSATMELIPGDIVFVSCADTDAIVSDARSGFTGFLTKP